MHRPPELHVEIPALQEGEYLIGSAVDVPSTNQSAAQYQPAPPRTVRQSICTRLKNNLDGCGAVAGATAVGAGVGIAVGAVTEDSLVAAVAGFGAAAATLVFAGCARCCRLGDGD